VWFHRSELAPDRAVSLRSLRRQPGRRRGLHWLLAIPVVPPLLVSLYSRTDPRLLGVPFFVWYQLACVLLAVGVTTAVYHLTKSPVRTE
jgi:hypothetical protein